MGFVIIAGYYDSYSKITKIFQTKYKNDEKSMFLFFKSILIVSTNTQNKGTNKINNFLKILKFKDFCKVFHHFLQLFNISFLAFM